MKTIIMVFAVLLAATTGFAQVKTTTTHRHGTKTHKHAHGHKYTCPMHPGIVRSMPGKCPKCNMKLVAVKKMKKDPIMADKKMDHEKM